LAAALLATTLAAPLTTALPIATLATPLDRVDVGGLILILLALHHGNCLAVLMPMQGEQVVRFHSQPPDDFLVVAFKLYSQPGREPL
jgi:hypothetical protein